MDLTALIAGVVAAVLVAVLFYFMPKLKKSQPNLPIEDYLESSKQLLSIIDGLSRTFNLGKNEEFVELVVKYAKLAVNYAEQLYKTGQLPSEERKGAALDFVKKAMKESGHELDKNQAAFTEAVIESMVFLLPKIK